MKQKLASIPQLGALVQIRLESLRTGIHFLKRQLSVPFVWLLLEILVELMQACWVGTCPLPTSCLYEDFSESCVRSCSAGKMTQRPQRLVPPGADALTILRT